MITNLKVEKDRNYLIFSDGDKQIKMTWKYDLNTGTIIGVKGNAVTRVPSGWKTAINEKCDKIKKYPFNECEETDYYLYCIWGDDILSTLKLRLLEKAFTANWFKDCSPMCIFDFIADIQCMTDDNIIFVLTHFTQIGHIYQEELADWAATPFEEVVKAIMNNS